MPDLIKEWWPQILTVSGAISWLTRLELRSRRAEKRSNENVSERMCTEMRKGCQQLQSLNFHHGKEMFDGVNKRLDDIQEDIKKLLSAQK